MSVPFDPVFGQLKTTERFIGISGSIGRDYEVPVGIFAAGGPDRINGWL